MPVHILTKNFVTKINSKLISLKMFGKCLSWIELSTKFPTRIFPRSLFVNIQLHDSFNVQDDDDFRNRVLKSKIPVVVDFHAKWCSPCKLLEPRIETMADKYHGQVSVARVDIDKLPDLAMNYDVTAVPSVVAIKEGQISDRFIGLQDEDKIEKFFEKLTDSDKV